MLLRKFTVVKKYRQYTGADCTRLVSLRSSFLRRLWPLVSRPSGPVKSSESCFFGQRLWLRAFSHQTFTMSLINQMDSTCIEKDTVAGIRQKYQANLVSEPVKLLGAWRRCLHASVDSRTGSVTNSSDGLIFVTRRAKDGRFFSKDTGVGQARQAKFKFRPSFCNLEHIQSVS